MTNGDGTSRSARRGELAAFLRAQRARLRPSDVGLPEDDNPGLRRTPGLRRDEVALLSGVGVTWCTWLAQGRNIPASEQVVDALARALLLDPDQHRHLRSLAGLATAPGETPVEDALPRLQRLADAENHARMASWEPAARAVLSQFRAAAAQQPDDPRFTIHDSRFTTIVAELTEASPEFRAWWAEYSIRHFRPATITIDHPEIGRIDLEMFQLRPVEYPDLLMVLQVPRSKDDLQRVTSLLNHH